MVFRACEVLRVDCFLGGLGRSGSRPQHLEFFLGKGGHAKN